MVVGLHAADFMVLYMGEASVSVGSVMLFDFGKMWKLFSPVCQRCLLLDQARQKSQMGGRGTVAAPSIQDYADNDNDPRRVLGRGRHGRLPRTNKRLRVNARCLDPLLSHSIGGSLIKYSSKFSTPTLA